MRGKRALVIVVALMVMVGSAIPFVMTVTAPPPKPKSVGGAVNANATGVRAYDPVQNGIVSIYMMNETENGTDVDVMKYNIAIGDYYLSSIEDNIPNWKEGAPGVVIVDVENGTFVTGDRAGYVAYITEIFDGNDPQILPNTTLRKIPVPTFINNGTNFIEFSWAPLPDPSGLIAGYTIYRSTDNNTWNLASGDKDNPVVGTLFNDTTVSAGTTYYYAIKVCFVGYSYDIPANVDNFESTYPGEGSSMMNSTKSPWIIDEIRITKDPFGIENYTTETINIGDKLTCYASGFNSTTGLFISSIEVDWTETGSLGTLLPLKDTQTIFTAGYVGGTTTVEAVNGTMFDDFTIIINDPTSDYINLTATPNGPKLTYVEINQGDEYVILASGYNNTGPTYVGLESVSWSVDFPSIGSIDNATGTITTLTGGDPGLVNVTGELSPGVTDTFMIRVLPIPTLDYIILTDGPNGAEITNWVIGVGITVEVFASGYSLIGPTYMGLVDVNWTLMPLGYGTIDVVKGTSTNFTAGSMGQAVDVDGTNELDPSLTDNCTITILDPVINFILIRSGDNGGGKNLSDPANYPTYPLDYSTTLYGAEYNYTVGYIGPVDAGSTWSSDTLTIATVTSPGYQTTLDCNDTNVGTAIITLDDGVRQTTTEVTVMAVTVDYIQIRDGPGGGGEVVIDPSYPVGATDIFYGARYNYSVDYIGDVPVTSTWGSSGTIVSVSPGTGIQTTITCSDTTAGTNTITLTDLDSGKSTTTQVTVLDPTVDYIIIVDTAGTGATIITDQTVDVGVKIMGYAASFNNTALYIGDVSVSWSVTNTGAAALTDPDTGVSSEFDSHNAGGTATWTAQFVVGVTDTVAFTINAPTVDYIQIRTASGDAGEVVTTWEFNVDAADTDEQYHCAAYNYSVGFIGNMGADWTVAGGIGTVVPGTGQFTVFTATTAGTGSITATYSGKTNSTGDITVYAKPTTPTGLQVQQVAAGEALDLVWSANPEAYVDGYNIYRSPTGAAGSFIKIADLVTGTSYQDTGLTNGDTYYYYIEAVGDFLAPNASDASATQSEVVDADTDDDGTFNLQDDDDDDDGLLDTEEDKNGNGIKDDDETDPLLWDTDGDGHNDKEDEYPLDPDKWEKEEEFPILLVILPIIIIIIIVLIVLMLLMKKRKPAEIPAVPEEERELPPPPGAMAEEEELPPEEEELPPEEEAPPEGEEEPPAEEVPPEEETPPGEEEPPFEKETPP